MMVGVVTAPCNDSCNILTQSQLNSCSLSSVRLAQAWPRLLLAGTVRGKLPSEVSKYTAHRDTGEDILTNTHHTSFH